MTINNEKVAVPFHEAIRNSLIILSIAGLRVAATVFMEKKPFEWSGEYLRLILAWAVAIIGICFGHAYLGSKIGRLKAGVIIGSAGLLALVVVLLKIS